MPTQKQHDANISNAQHSTGPRTDAGRSKASLNAFKHGFRADDATLYDDPETSQQISDRVTRYFDHYLSPLEEATVSEIAFCEIRPRTPRSRRNRPPQLLPPARLPAALLLGPRRQALPQIRPRQPPP